jgi:acyl phosphate:glycerol-3-phosphate acyltransferase
MTILTTLLIFAIAYLLGSIPFGPMLGRLYGVDLMKVGSGSTGTTNVMRAMGFWAGILVLLGDIGKGVLSAYLALLFLHAPIFVVLAGIIAMLGHSHSIFIKFKGGKSAATGVGVVLVMSPQAFLIVVVIVVALIFLTRYQSVASLGGAAAAPVIMHYFHAPTEYVVMTAIASLFVWYKHMPNITRLVAGTENKISLTSSSKRTSRK